MATRDQTFLTPFSVSIPTVIHPSPIPGRLGRTSIDSEVFQAPLNAGIAAQLSLAGQSYIPLNTTIWKSYVPNPTNQGQRAAVAQRQSMMFDPRNSPSRSQKQEGYTAPLQLFASSNVWQTPNGQTSKGKRMKQPSVKQVSPFASLPIPTRMPWDL